MEMTKRERIQDTGQRTDGGIIASGMIEAEGGLVRVKDEWKGWESLHQDGLKWVSWAPQPPKLR